MPDRRGSGKNASDRGHAPSARRLIDDVHEAMSWLRERSGVDHVHLIGVSWGGKLALAAHVAEPGATASLSLIAPGLFPIIDVTFSQKLRIAVALLFGRRRCFPIPLGEPSLFTDVAERQEYIRDDTLSVREATASFFWASRRLDGAMRVARVARPAPLRVFLAERDRIIRNAATRAWVRSLDGWPARGVVEYAGAAHTLEFEPSETPFISDLVEWITLGAAAANV